MNLTLFAGNDMRLLLSGLRNRGELVENADVSVSLLYPGGAEAWAGDLQAVEDAPGDYETVIPDDTDVGPGELLVGTLEATAGGFRLEYSLAVDVVARTPEPPA